MYRSPNHEYEYPRFCAPGMGGVQHIAFIEMLCALGAVFQHRAHGGVAVDICVFALDIAVGCILVGDASKVFISLSFMFLTLVRSAR